MKHKNRFWLLVALLLAFALRVYALDVQSLWNDEGTSVALASLSIEAIINSAARDIHPPLYYLLLHFWLPFAGSTEYAVRFLSVIAGVVIVALVFRIAYFVFDKRVATFAALLVALSPFQVYYSQEARMYIWVTLWAAVSVWAFVKLKVKSSKFKVETAEVSGQRSVVSGQKSEVGMWVVYVVATLAALYTQYVGAFIVLAENLAFGVWLFFAIRNSQFTIRNLQSAIRTLAPWLIGQLIIGSLFLPWYLFAGGQLASWPSISEPLDLPTLVWRVLNVFSIGLTLDGNLATITSILLGGLFLLGCWRPTVPLSHCFTVPLSHCPTVPLSHRPTVPLLLWTLVPVAAMYIVSLTRPAYNPKFLLLATPAFYILAARGLSFVLCRSSFVLRRSSFILCSLLILAGSALSLLNYYTDPRYARDDYRTILQFIDAHERAGDGILVNAPGQIDVVRYYWHGSQLLFLLPRMRPPDPSATRADVDEMLDKTERLFAIYWATDQSDPARVVETRLAERAFKARDEWHGNVRLVLYGIAPRSRSVPQPLDVRFGDAMTLTSYQLDARRARVGDVLTLTLHWRVEQMPNARYKIFVHLLDASGRVVAQRDGEPLADLRPTTTWRAGETLADNYGVFIEPDAPPGDYRVEIGVYRADDGARVPVGESDHLILGTVQVK
jgi:mannosyltransferase